MRALRGDDNHSTLKRTTASAAALGLGAFCWAATAMAAGSGLALVLDGGTRQGPGPTVVDCRVSPPVVRQVGALPESYIDAVLLLAAQRRKRLRKRPRSIRSRPTSPRSPTS